MNNLRKASLVQNSWTKDEIKSGLLSFYKEFGRFPTANEIDSYQYLPSSRSIQRSFGGLVNLRKELIPDSHFNFTKGSYRSTKAREGDRRARLYEEEFYIFLTEHFQAIAVHEHKIIRPGNVASDFFIYLEKDKGVVIDLFYAQDLRSLISIVNIKLKRYITLPFETYLILVGNPAIQNFEINQKMKNRLTLLPSHIDVVTEQSFKESIVNSLINRSDFAL